MFILRVKIVVLLLSAVSSYGTDPASPPCTVTLQDFIWAIIKSSELIEV